jgi:hypothetical protein
MRFVLRGSMIVFGQGGWRRGSRELSFNMDVEEAAFLVLLFILHVLPWSNRAGNWTPAFELVAMQPRG